MIFQCHAPLFLPPLDILEQAKCSAISCVPWKSLHVLIVGRYLQEFRWKGMSGTKGKKAKINLEDARICVFHLHAQLRSDNWAFLHKFSEPEVSRSGCFEHADTCCGHLSFANKHVQTFFGWTRSFSPEKHCDSSKLPACMHGGARFAHLCFLPGFGHKWSKVRKREELLGRACDKCTLSGVVLSANCPSHSGLQQRSDTNVRDICASSRRPVLTPRWISEQKSLERRNIFISKLK